MIYIWGVKNTTFLFEYITNPILTGGTPLKIHPILMGATPLNIFKILKNLTEKKLQGFQDLEAKKFKKYQTY